MMCLRTSILMWMTAVATSVAMAVTPVMSLPMEMDEDGQVTETVKAKSYTVRGRHADNVEAVVGKGLRMDGYSSFIQIPMNQYSLNNQTLSISLWTACQTYPMMVMDVADNQEGAILSCLNEESQTGFAFFLYSQGKYGFTCYINGEKKILTPPALFPQYAWVHLCVTIDAANHSMCLYQNGVQVATAYINGTLNLPTGNLYLGKSYTDVKAGQFYLNTYNGALDEFNIYNECLSAAEVQTQAGMKSSQPIENSLNLPASHFTYDLTRPRHHAMPASNWMNESHGMAYANGRFHIFFQKNGNGPYMSRLHWGHLSSADLCNWTEERIAIVPGKAYDLKGCWSGCVFTDQTITKGEPWILYTGVDNTHASINLATPVDDDLSQWQKYNLNPVISGTPAGYSADFRDPYFFRNGDNAYCIVGTSQNGIASTSLHVYNPTTKVFDYTGKPFFTGPNSSLCGTFFEMSNITPMGNGKWLFTATPLGTAQGVKTIYYVGTINADGTFSTSQSVPKPVELPNLARDGYGLLSPTILQKDGKTIAIGIVPDKVASSVNFQSGWAHTLSLPREWSVDAQGELIQKPYEGLQALRSETSVAIDNRTLNGEMNLNPVSGLEIEVEASFTVGNNPFGIKILQSSNGTACKIYYHPQQNRFVVDFSEIGHKENDGGIFSGVYSTVLPATIGKGQTMKIHVYFDHSVLDLFINDRWASSIRIFPTSSAATGVSLFAEGNTELQSAAAWTMKPTENDIPQGIEQIIHSEQGQNQKQIQNGQLLIKQHNRVYNATGLRLQ